MPAAGAAWEPGACSGEKPRDRLRVRSASKTASAASTAVLEVGGGSCWGAAVGPAGAAAADAGLLLLEERRDRWPALSLPPSPQAEDALSWAGSPPSLALPLTAAAPAAASEKGLLVLLPLLLLATAALVLFLSDCREGGRPSLCPGLLFWEPSDEPATAAAAVELEAVLLMLDLDLMVPRVCT